MALQACPECGHRISERASACPSCGAPVKTSPVILNPGQTPEERSNRAMAGCLAALLVCGALICAGIWNISSVLDWLDRSDSSGRSFTPEEELKFRQEVRQRQQKLAELQPEFDRLIQSGKVAVNLNANRVRLSASEWDRLTLREKQEMLAFFTEYFDAKGSGRFATILSDRNDEKFGDVTALNGLRVYR